MVDTRPGPVSERLLQRRLIVEETGCWEYTGLRVRGYGQISVEGRGRGVHRVAYETWVGPIPPGLVVCHTCDNPPCFNPEHLWVGTYVDNQQDCISKGRRGSTTTARGEMASCVKLTNDQVMAIRWRAANGESDPELGRRYGVTAQNIRKIVSRRTWRHLP